MKIQNLVESTAICPTCNGLGYVKNEICFRCEGSGEEEVLVCETCGETMQGCDCFPQIDVPLWCGLDPSWGQECPASEEEVEEAIENLLFYCQSCPYAALTKQAA